MSWEKHKNDKLSAEIHDNDKKMMEKAKLKREAEESLKPKELGKFEVKLMSSTEHTEEDIKKFKEKLLTFETMCNAELPMFRVHIVESVKRVDMKIMDKRPK